MKKILLGLSAFAMLFATSCQNDQGFDTTIGETSTVTFAVETPEIATRAYSDGLTATHLQYAVYDANGNELTDLTVTDATINGSTTVNLQLTTGNTYSVIFWAAAEGAPYTVNFATKKMTVDYTNATSNDEARDAFYKYHTFKVTGAQTETIELRRPFAQLNIGTADYAASTSAGYTPIKSAVVVKNIYSTLDLATGDVDGSAAAEFGSADIKKDETFPVAGYEYMAMNYLLVAADKEVVDVVFTYTDANNNAKERTVGSVPVQRNYRTNIYGELLTSEVDINVEIVPEYEEPAHELDALHKAALNGGTFTLTEDVVLTATLEVMGDLTIDLNGKTISGNIHKSNGAVVKNNGTLTITGGTISSIAENGGSAIQNNGTLVVNDATLAGAPNANGSWPSYAINNTGVMTINNSTITSYHGAVASYGNEAVATLNNTNIDMTGIQGMTSHGIYTYNNGKVIVNGGNIANKATDQNATGASAINGAVTVNAGNITGRIENYYGTPVLKGGVYTVQPKAQFIATGYHAVENNGKYYVVAEETDAVATNTAELNEALANSENDTIELLSGEYTINGNFPAGATIIGAGENVVLNIEDKIYTVNGTATIENVKVVFSNNGYKGFQGGVDLNFKECTIEGQPFLYGTKATFEGCTFVQNDAEQYNVWTYAVLEANFIECVFNCAGKSVLVYSEAGDLVQNVNFEDCTFNASAPYDGKAAIEIGAAQLTTGMYNVNINDTEVNNFANGNVSGNPVWNVKNGNRANVVVDGEICTVGGAEKVSDGLWKSGSTYSVTNAEGLASINAVMAADNAGVGITINLLSDIDFTGKTWTPVRSHIDWKSTMNEFNGNGHTIKNLTINGQAMFTIFANTHDVVVKDITFDNATVTCNGLNSAIIVGQTYDNLLLDNVDVKNSAITGTYKVATLVGTVYDEKASTVTATLKNCDVANTSVTSTQYDFCTAGMVSFVYADNNDKIEFENCTVSDVKLYGPTTYGYKAHAAIYTTGSESLFNEAAGVTVTNVTFENI